VEVSVSRLLESAGTLSRHVAKRLKALPYHGRGTYCPVCEKTFSRFLRFGVVPRENALCPWCGALERHRFVWLFFRTKTDLFDGTPKRVLHVAPESCLEARLHDQLREGYLTADLSDPKAMVQLDITNIRYPDSTFDVVYASHVFEHVPDDRRAMQECYRVLRPAGWAVLNVPITAPATFEDRTAVGPEQRLRIFGHRDHVRAYGPDYASRLAAAGFGVQIVRVSDVAADEDAVVMGLTEASGEIYYCTKSSTKG